MFDGLIRLLETILHLDKSKLIPFAIVLIVIFSLGVPLVKNYFFRYTELEAQARILGELARIDALGIKNEQLQESYAELLNSFDAARTKKSITIQMIYDQIRLNFWKFLSGASVWVIMILASLFIKGEKMISRLGDVFLCLLLGVIAGYIGVIIPSFNPIWINYIGFPVVEVFIIFLFAYFFADSTSKAK